MQGTRFRVEGLRVEGLRVEGLRGTRSDGLQAEANHLARQHRRSGGAVTRRVVGAPRHLSGAMDNGYEFMIWDLGFRIQGLGFRV